RSRSACRCESLSELRDGAKAASYGLASRQIFELGHRALGLQGDDEIVAGELNVAGAESDDDVAGTDDFGKRGGDIFAPGDVAHVLVVAGADLFDQGFRARALDGSLAGGEDVADEHLVGIVEGLGKLVELIFGARVAMRLE